MPVPTLVTLGLLAVACTAERAEPNADAPAPDGATRIVTAPAADSLTFQILVPDDVRSGERVPLVLRIENRGARPLDLYLRGRTITADLEVTRADGEPVWRRLEGEIIPAILHIRTLAPGERLEVEAEWNQRTLEGALVATGVYRVRGLLLVEGDPWATKWVAFRIVG
jgi:hypothetical protein